MSASNIELVTQIPVGGNAITIHTPAAAGQYEIDIPDGGALFDSGAFIDATDVQITSVTLVYAGGVAA